MISKDDIQLFATPITILNIPKSQFWLFKAGILELLLYINDNSNSSYPELAQPLSDEEDIEKPGVSRSQRSGSKAKHRSGHDHSSKYDKSLNNTTSSPLDEESSESFDFFSGTGPTSPHLHHHTSTLKHRNSSAYSSNTAADNSSIHDSKRNSYIEKSSNRNSYIFESSNRTSYIESKSSARSSFIEPPSSSTSNRNSFIFGTPNLNYDYPTYPTSKITMPGSNSSGSRIERTLSNSSNGYRHHHHPSYSYSAKSSSSATLSHDIDDSKTKRFSNGWMTAEEGELRSPPPPLPPLPRASIDDNDDVITVTKSALGSLTNSPTRSSSKRPPKSVPPPLPASSRTTLKPAPQRQQKQKKPSPAIATASSTATTTTVIETPILTYSNIQDHLQQSPLTDLSEESEYVDAFNAIDDDSQNVLKINHDDGLFVHLCFLDDKITLMCSVELINKFLAQPMELISILNTTTTSSPSSPGGSFEINPDEYTMMQVNNEGESNTTKIIQELTIPLTLHSVNLYYISNYSGGDIILFPSNQRSKVADIINEMFPTTTNTDDETSSSFGYYDNGSSSFAPSSSSASSSLSSSSHQNTKQHIRLLQQLKKRLELETTETIKKYYGMNPPLTPNLDMKIMITGARDGDQCVVFKEVIESLTRLSCSATATTTATATATANTATATDPTTTSAHAISTPRSVLSSSTSTTASPATSTTPSTPLSKSTSAVLGLPTFFALTRTPNEEIGLIMAESDFLYDDENNNNSKFRFDEGKLCGTLNDLYLPVTVNVPLDVSSDFDTGASATSATSGVPSATDTTAPCPVSSATTKDTTSSAICRRSTPTTTTAISTTSRSTSTSTSCSFEFGEDASIDRLLTPPFQPLPIDSTAPPIPVLNTSPTLKQQKQNPGAGFKVNTLLSSSTSGDGNGTTSNGLGITTMPRNESIGNSIKPTIELDESSEGLLIGCRPTVKLHTRESIDNGNSENTTGATSSSTITPASITPKSNNHYSATPNNDKLIIGISQKLIKFLSLEELCYLSFNPCSSGVGTDTETETAGSGIILIPHEFSEDLIRLIDEKEW